jgi:hypothetical protein
MSTNHDWLTLIEVSGPFLAVAVLREVLPQGLEALTSGRPQRLRAAYDEWRDAVDADDADLPAIHSAWIDEVLQSALEVDDQVLRRAATLPERLKVSRPVWRSSIRPKATPRFCSSISTIRTPISTPPGTMTGRQRHRATAWWRCFAASGARSVS